VATVQPLNIFDANGPKADATPIFVATFGYVDRAGAARALPAGLITNRGAGLYTFLPTDDDEVVGTCALIDCGVGCQPRYQVAAISGPNNQFGFAVPLDGNGELSAGAFTVGSYIDLNNGSARPPPAVVKAGAFELYTVTPTAQDAAIGVGLRLDAPANVFPPIVSFSFSGSAVPAGTPAFGGLEDMSDVIEMLASGTYTVTRRSPPAFLAGRRQPPIEAVFTTIGSVQPASGQVVDRLPEGKRNHEAMTMWCQVQLKTAEAGQEPDVVAIDGASFEVESCKRWAALGNYYEAVLTRRPGT
jgi:hypothetical protein